MYNIKVLDLQNRNITKQIINLQKEAYSIEAKLTGFYQIPTLKDTCDTINSSDEIFYGCYNNEDLIGIISYKIETNILDIHRLAVKPSYFRKGIGTILLKYVEANNQNSTKAVVSTGRNNFPAKKLYLKNGYEAVKDIQVSNDFYMTIFEKILNTETFKNINI